MYRKNYECTLFKTYIVTKALQIVFSKLFVECKRLEVVEGSFLFAIFNESFCLVEIDIWMIAETSHTGTVQIDTLNLFRLNLEPTLYGTVVQMDVL